MQSESKTISIMQPTYLPWLGYFNLIKNSNEFILYTTTQLAKRSWQTRNKIKTSNGNLFLTIPILKSESRKHLIIKNAKVQNQINWKKKHLSSIKQSYSKTPFFDQIFPILESKLRSNSEYLIDYTIPIILELVEHLGIKTKVLFSHNIIYNGMKDDALISICNNRKSKNYISPKGSQEYILSGNNLFEKNHINLVWQDYEHPLYNQLFPPFESHLSILDSLFMLGFEGVEKLI